MVTIKPTNARGSRLNWPCGSIGFLAAAPNGSSGIAPEGCLRSPPMARENEARYFSREVLEEPVADDWARLAKEGLLASDYGTREAKARCFSFAPRHTTNSLAAQFYDQVAKTAAED